MSHLRLVKQYDDSRILEGKVSDSERSDLEVTLRDMYLKKALREGKEINLHYEPDTYDALKTSDSFFSEFHLLVDKHHRVLDMTPITYHLLDTDEGLFYAKLMLHDEYPLR